MVIEYPDPELSYQSKDCSIYHGNSSKIRSVIDDESVHLICTSPPYYNAKEYSHWEDYFDYLVDMHYILAQCFHTLVDGGRICVNVPMDYGRTKLYPIGMDISRILQEIGYTLRGHIIWNKGNSSNLGTAWGSWMSAKNPSLVDVYEIIIVAHKGSAGRESGKDTIDRETFLTSTKSIWNIDTIRSSWHPAPFPPEIPRRLISLYSFLGDTVLDPFAGSLTTIFVANQLGRKAIGVETSQEYIDQALGIWKYA